MTGDQQEIERAFHHYYKGLFAFRRVELEAFKTEFISTFPIIDEEYKESLSQPITVAEVECAIDSLNNGNSPGSDGLTVAFYKVFKNDLSSLLAALFNEAFELKAFPPSYGEAHTILIPKTRDTDKLKHVTAYRRLSLTNVDPKIFMKVLAQRIQTVIKQIVGPHQTCGIKGCTIFSHLHKTRCVLEGCDCARDRVAVLQLDLEKAFDCVSHELLLLILDHVSVGTATKEGVALAYRKCTPRLIVNKMLEAPISVERSVCQGCPLSPLLFCQCIETLCLNITESEHIRGFQLCEAEVKLLAYADDIPVFCTTKESVTKVVDIVKRFGSITGSWVNRDKCLGFCHGA